MEFINFADQHRIIIIILLLYTTHRLQPLDVGLFQPLSTAYSGELDNLIITSRGLVSISKSLFFPMFKRAWDKSFTTENIQHAFQKPGIWPVYSDEMIAKVTQPAPKPEQLSKDIKTPLSAKAIRHFRQEFELSPTKKRINKVFKATETMASKISILEHENRGLRQAIIIEQSKHKKGKKLNLCSEESQGAEVYSPEKVAKARVYQEEKEAQELVELEVKEARKIQRAANALRKKQEQEEKEDRQAVAQLVKDLKATTLAVPKVLSKDTKPVAVKAKRTAPIMLKAKEAPAPSINQPKSANKIPDPILDIEEGEEEVVTQNRRGRQIKRPSRYI